MYFPQILMIVAGAEAASRPWLLSELGREFVNKAVQYRLPNVPQNEASEIASRIESGAVAPPQVTTLIEAASAAFMQYGTAMPPGVALSLAKRASSDYDEVKRIPGFANYLEYVSANANKFNFEAIQHDSASSPFVPQIQNVLAQLTQTAQGKEAYDTAMKLVSTIEYDAGIERRPSQHQAQPPPAVPQRQPPPAPAPQQAQPPRQGPPQRAPPQYAPPPYAPNAPQHPPAAPQGMSPPPPAPAMGMPPQQGSPHAHFYPAMPEQLYSQDAPQYFR